MPVDEMIAEEPVVETEASEPVEEAADIPAEADTAGEAEPAEEQEEEQGEETEEEGTEEAIQDGRKLPDAIKKGLSQLQKLNSPVAKELRRAYMQEQQYKSTFPTPQEAIQAKGFIEQIGGPEGLQELQAEREEWQEIDQSFAEGKPEFVQGLAASNPEAFQKIAPQVINTFAEKFPSEYRAYQDIVAANVVMSIPNIEPALNDLVELHKQLGEYPQFQRAIANVVNGIVGLNDKKTEAQTKRVDPREEQFKQKETQFEQQRRGDFEGQVYNEATSYLQKAMQPEIDRIVAGRKVSEATMKDYQAKVASAVAEALAKVPGFEKQLEANYRTGDRARSVKYITDTYNRILPEAAKVIDPYVRDIPAAAPAKGASATRGATRTASEPGVVMLKEMPDPKELMQTPTMTRDMMLGHGTLKNGKKVQWPAMFG